MSQNPYRILGLTPDQQARESRERIAALALDPAYAALLGENDQLRERLTALREAAEAVVEHRAGQHGIVHTWCGIEFDSHVETLRAALATERS